LRTLAVIQLAVGIAVTVVLEGSVAHV